MTQKNHKCPSVSLLVLCGHRFSFGICPRWPLGVTLPGYRDPTLSGRDYKQGPAVTNHSGKETSPVVLPQ